MNVWILAWFESFPLERHTSPLPPHGAKEPELKGYLIMGSPQFASKKEGGGEEEKVACGTIFHDE